MRNFLHAMCVSLLILSHSVLAKDSLNPKVATVSPIAYSLTQALTEGTGIEVSYLPPKRLPVSRIPSWIHKNKTKKFERFDAIISTRSVESKLDMFSSLRQTSIRLVEIDIASAILPKGERVVLSSPNEYYWLNSNNLSLMLGILKRDLSLLWPNKAKKLSVNYQQLSAQIRRTNLKNDELLTENEVAFMVIDNKKLLPLAASLASDVVQLDEAKEFALPYVVITTKKSKTNDVKWVVDDFSRVKNDPFVKRLQNNQAALKAILML